MPRKSAAALSVVTPLPGQKRPEPPKDLTSDEADEWRAVVERLPPDWFPRESQQLLVQYCRHVVKARVIAGLVKGFDPEWAATDEGLWRYDKLLQMADREARAMTSLATKMRISQQSRWQPSSARSKSADPDASRKPWQAIA